MGFDAVAYSEIGYAAEGREHYCMFGRIWLKVRENPLKLMSSVWYCGARTSSIQYDWESNFQSQLSDLFELQGGGT